MNAKKVLFSVLLMMSLITISGQPRAQVSMFGKNFYTAFGPNAPEELYDMVQQLTIISLDTAHVHIEVPAISFTLDTTVFPNIVTDVALQKAICAITQEILPGMAVSVTSDKDLQIIATNYKHLSCDAWPVYPSPSLGKEYFTLNYPTSIYDATDAQPGEIVIVATQDTTAVSATSLSHNRHCSH
jgi:hypothetical protein